MDAVLDHPALGMPALAEAYREAARARYRAIASVDPRQRRSSSRAGSPAPTSSGGTRDSETYGHAIVQLRLPTGRFMYLDSDFDEPMTKKELAAAGYHFFDWSDQ
jgi:hypothetical protein